MAQEAARTLWAGFPRPRTQVRAAHTRSLVVVERMLLEVVAAKLVEVAGRTPLEVAGRTLLEAQPLERELRTERAKLRT